MCGRFRVARKKEILEESFGIGEVMDDLDWTPRYNVAPTQMIPVIRSYGGEKPGRTLSQMRWGLIPYWAKDPAIGSRMINARAESVAQKPAFAEALRWRRCLIPADGFYEWRREGKQKLPYCITLAGDSLFAFAGVWERWHTSQPAKYGLAGAPGRDPKREIVESCAILTTEANELLREIHDRMPVILAPADYDLWLDPGFTRVKELLPLLKPYPAAAMRMYRVSPRVNQVIYDDAECAAEIGAA